MDDKIINLYDFGANKVEFNQNASGFWTCKLSINCFSILAGLELMDQALNRAIEILKDKNNKTIKKDK